MAQISARQPQIRAEMIFYILMPMGAQPNLLAMIRIIRALKKAKSRVCVVFLNLVMRFTRKNYRNSSIQEFIKIKS